jgi:DNA invertase Pin-like site-specific DNA recombinase
MTDVSKKRVDIVLVWKFDRFARSVSHLLNALETFRSVGVEFASISEQIDTLSAAGKLVFTILAAVGELEKSLIAERVRMGVQQARRKGVRLGRPPLRVLSSNELEKVRQDRAIGKLSLRALARRHGISVWAAQQAVSKTDLAA